MSAFDDYTDKTQLLQRRFNAISRFGQLDAMLPKPRVGLVLVGGPRNRSGSIPAETQSGLNAAFKACIRAEAHIMAGSL